jgi:hypothetical protein
VRLLLAIVALAPACTTVANEPAPDAIAALSEPGFRCTVEPILARDCSYTGCHGNAGFALRVYSAGKLRAGAMDTLDARIAPLTEAEHHGNFLSASAFSYGDVAPDDDWLIRKGLPTEDGGYEHHGGAIFTGPDDARVVAIRAWLAGGNGCAEQTP